MDAGGCPNSPAGTMKKKSGKGHKSKVAQLFAKGLFFMTEKKELGRERKKRERKERMEEAEKSATPESKQHHTY